MGNSSAAASIAVTAGEADSSRAVVTIALAPTRPSAATISCLRQSSGKGAAIMPARSTAMKVMTLSTVLASCIATTVSVCRPSRRSCAASAEIARSASA